MSERPYERFLRVLVSRALGSPVVHVDDGSRPSMHDAEIYYPDGRVGAVEFTTVGLESALETEAMPSSLLLETPHVWALHYAPEGVRWKDIQKHVPVIVEQLDMLGLASADYLPRVLGEPAVDWYDRSNVSLRRYRSGARGGRVYILPDSMSGVVDEDYHSLVPWVESLQSEPTWIDNLRKLAVSGCDELHLVVRMHQTGVPFGLAQAIWSGRPIRVGDPKGMSPLTDLWLVPRWGPNAARWNARDGWSIIAHGAGD